MALSLNVPATYNSDLKYLTAVDAKQFEPSIFTGTVRIIHRMQQNVDTCAPSLLLPSAFLNQVCT
jgi:hypothetical protein